jgi:hypothetical protein
VPRTVKRSGHDVEKLIWRETREYPPDE